ncbi:MAG: hypothetical protein L6R43_14245 [Planctomycetes bacterium]|nr:hypothetical protein [Planctomycetota bacterium]
METPPFSPFEEWVDRRARELLGADVRLRQRLVVTKAGGRTGCLVVGYRIVRVHPGGVEEMLGSSPPEGSRIDLSDLGNAEQALRAALEAAGMKVLPPKNGRPMRRPPGADEGETTSETLEEAAVG